MKIALCYSGLASRFNKDDIDALLTQFDGLKSAATIDVYVSVWNDGTDLALVRACLESAMAQCPQVRFGTLETECNDTPPYSLKYNDEHTWSKLNKANAIFCMFHGIRNADQMRTRSGAAYDLIVRSRPDVTVQGTLDLALWDRITGSESLAIFPKSYNFFHFWNPQGGMLCDQFFAAKPDIMEKIVTIPDDIDQMCDAGCRFHPESLLWWKMRYGIGLPARFNNPVNPWYAFQDFFVFLRGKVFI